MAASPHLSAWQRLARYVEQRRDELPLGVTEVQRSIMRRLKGLARQGRCDPRVVGWFETEGGRLRLTDSATAKVGARPAIALQGLEHLEAARLTLVVTCERKRVRSYSLQLCSGTCDEDRPSWYARIDLTEKPAGVGLCSHALLHAHVGVSPLDAWSARVPLPWLHPADALDWLLATVDPRLEPQPT